MSAEQTIDLTGHGQHLRYVEILTDAGTVRVNVNLEDTQTRQRVVVVEVEPNGPYRQHTAAGGDWAIEVRETFAADRIDIRLTRQDGEVAR